MPEHNILEALMNDDYETAKKLILNDAPINIKDAFGLSPLHIAVQKKLNEITQLLLEHKADPNIRNSLNEIAIEALTPTNLPSSPDEITEEIFEELIELGNITPLHIAVKNGFSDIAALLIQFGASVDIRDSGGCTPLHWAAMNGDLTCAKLLLEAEADVNAEDIIESIPLHEAVRHKDVKMTRFLLEKGANVHKQDITGQSPIDCALDDPALLNLILQYSLEHPVGVTKH